MRFLSIIEAKRDGEKLSPEQIRQVVAACTAGQIPDYQLAAFLMAVYFSGLDPAETRALTLAMRDSGDVLQFPPDERPLVDKHSTGGIGDKVSLPLAPLLACLGFRVPMISGRGLGITGGTLDKLDSIPGFSTALSNQRIIEVVQEVGCVICGQTERMVPADRILYSLRDVTGTVPSIPLIVASILSKKLAEGLEALVLDVKFGPAAFMPTLEKARELALAIVSLGNDCGVNTRALLTKMDTPLGRAAGNWLEVKEAVLALEPATKGIEQGAIAQHKSHNGRSSLSPPDDLQELVLACAAQLLVQTKRAKSQEEARRQAQACLKSGRPRKKWDEMLTAQGADLEAFNRKLTKDHTAPVVVEIQAEKPGFISRCDAKIIGEIVRDLGGGRVTKESVLNYDVGVDRLIKPGEPVEPGQVLARIHAADAGQAELGKKRLLHAIEFSNQPPPGAPLVQEIV